MQNGNILFRYLTITIQESTHFLLHLTSSIKSSVAVIIYISIFPAHQINF